MPRRHRIFEREQLNQNQLRTVAERRFVDARALLNLQNNRHANGAMYLAGFVLECLLKAKLLDQYRWLINAASAGNRSRSDQRIWSLCYRSHDLSEILAILPAVREHIASADQQRHSLTISLHSVCEQWTIFARYSPHVATLADGAEFLARVEELKQWLR